MVGDGTAVSGFLGALFAGFAAGIIVNLLKKAFSWLPKARDGIKPVFLYPLFGTFLVGALMCLINPIIGVLIKRTFITRRNKPNPPFNSIGGYDGNRYGRSFQQGCLCIRHSSYCRRQHVDYGSCNDRRYGASYCSRSFNNFCKEQMD